MAILSFTLVMNHSFKLVGTHLRRGSMLAQQLRNINLGLYFYLLLSLSLLPIFVLKSFQLNHQHFGEPEQLY